MDNLFDDEVMTMADNSFFSDNFRSVYDNIEKSFHSVPMTDVFFPKEKSVPNILNFAKNDSKHNMSHTNYYSTIDLKSRKESYNSKTDSKTDTEKCGVKTLINTKSKITYPFSKNRPESVASEKLPNATLKVPVEIEKTIANTSINSTKLEENIISDALDQNENFIINANDKYPESETIISIETIPDNVKSTIEKVLVGWDNDQDQCQNQCYEPEHNDDDKEIILFNSKTESDIKSNTVPNQQTLNHATNLGTDTMAPDTENFSDIGVKMPRESLKKIDIKNDDNIIKLSKEHPKMNTENIKPTESISCQVVPLTENVIETEPDAPPVSVVNETTEVLKSPQLTEKNSENKNKYQWPKLTIDNINTSFRVVANLKEGTKIIVVDDRYLAEDNSYMTFISRSISGQGREKIMSFLEHLLEESKQTAYSLLHDIRAEINMDNNVSELDNLHKNLCNFLHRFNVMRDVYKKYSDVFSKFGVIRDKFFTFESTFFREMVVPRKH